MTNTVFSAFVPFSSASDRPTEIQWVAKEAFKLDSKAVLVEVMENGVRVFSPPKGGDIQSAAEFLFRFLEAFRPGKELTFAWRRYLPSPSKGTYTITPPRRRGDVEDVEAPLPPWREALKRIMAENPVQ